MNTATPTSSCVSSWRRRLLTIAFAALAVFAGSVIGSGLTIITFRNSMFPRPPQPEAVASSLLERMSSLFEMTDGETDSVREIIDRRMKEVKRIRQSSFDEMRGQFDGMRQELAVVLGPERAEAWEKFLRESRPRSPWGGGPPSGSGPGSGGGFGGGPPWRDGREGDSDGRGPRDGRGGPREGRETRPHTPPMAPMEAGNGAGIPAE